MYDNKEMIELGNRKEREEERRRKLIKVLYRHTLFVERGAIMDVKRESRDFQKRYVLFQDRDV